MSTRTWEPPRSGDNFPARPCSVRSSLSLLRTGLLTRNFFSFPQPSRKAFAHDLICAAKATCWISKVNQTSTTIKQAPATHQNVMLHERSCLEEAFAPRHLKLLTQEVSVSLSMTSA